MQSDLPTPDVPGLLKAIADGDPTAAESLFPIVYSELHRIAAAYMRHERPGHTLQATALVHEAFVRLVGPNDHAGKYENLRHFVAAASIAMRRILVNHAKSKATGKRGGNVATIALDDVASEFDNRAVSLAALDDALTVLAQHDARQARLVELRFFGGMSMEDCAHALGISVRSAHYEWAHARAWLKGRLEAA